MAFDRTAIDRYLERIITGLRSETSLTQLVPKVNIDVANGRVTLRWSVPTEQERRTIAGAVERATGSPVDDQLQVAEQVRTP